VLHFYRGASTPSRSVLGRRRGDPDIHAPEMHLRLALGAMVAEGYTDRLVPYAHTRRDPWRAHALPRKGCEIR
jgi:hypothetical protein